MFLKIFLCCLPRSLLQVLAEATWTPEGAAAPAHSLEAPSPRVLASQRKPELSSCDHNQHGTDPGLEAMQEMEVLHVRSLCVATDGSIAFLEKKEINTFTTMLRVPIDFTTCSDFTQVKKMERRKNGPQKEENVVIIAGYKFYRHLCRGLIAGYPHSRDLCTDEENSECPGNSHRHDFT